MENNNLKIKICKKCSLSEYETKIMKERHVCNKCRNTITNAKLNEKGYFTEYSEKNKASLTIKYKEYYEKNKDAILIKRHAHYQRKKQTLQQTEN